MSTNANLQSRMQQLRRYRQGGQAVPQNAVNRPQMASAQPQQVVNPNWVMPSQQGGAQTGLSQQLGSFMQQPQLDAQPQNGSRGQVVPPSPDLQVNRGGAQYAGSQQGNQAAHPIQQFIQEAIKHGYDPQTISSFIGAKTGLQKPQ